MERYIEFILKRPVFIIILIFLIKIFFGFGITKIKFDTSLDAMMPKDDSQYILYEKLKDKYNNIGKFIVMNVTDDDIWNKEFFNDLNNLIIDIEEYKEFNKERENQRIKRLKGLIKRGTISKTNFLKSMSDDLPFLRCLTRITDKNFKDCKNLEKDDLKKILHINQGFYDLKKLSRISRIISPFTITDISGKNDTLKPYDLIESDSNGKRILPQFKEEFEKFKKKLQKNPVFENAIFARDPKSGRISDFGIIVELTNAKIVDNIVRRVWDITRSYENISITLQGLPIINMHINDYMINDLNKFFPLSSLVVIIVFFLNFRSFRGVFLPILTILIADIWVIGLMGHLNVSINSISISLPALMVTIGSSYSIHVLNQYYTDSNLITDKGKYLALKHSMSHISVTVFLAGLTTFLGFFSLISNEIPAVNEWGFFSGIGALFSVLLTTSLLPATFMLLPHRNIPNQNNIKNKLKGKTWIDPIIQFFIRISTHHNKAVLATVTVLLIVSIVGIIKMRVSTSFIAQFKKNDIVRTSAFIIGEKFGGFLGMCILLDSGEMDGIKDPKFLKQIEKFKNWLTSEKNRDLQVGRVDAFTDVIKTMHMTMNNDNKRYYKIPDDKSLIVDYMEIYSGEDEDSDGRPDEFETYFDPHYRTALIFARLKESESSILFTEDICKIQKRISQHLKNTLPEKYSYKITGETTLITKLAQYITDGQLSSLMFCLLTVVFIIIILFKNFKAGLVAFIPMGVALIFLFGIMGWFGIRLDTATAIISSVAIGVGIDDTIHFLNTYRYFRVSDSSIDETIKKTLLTSGKAITYTSLALIFGFIVLISSSFIPIIQFGFLASITMIATTIGALLILPAFIKTTKVNLEESKSNSLLWRYLYIGKVFHLESDNQDKARG